MEQAARAAAPAAPYYYVDKGPKPSVSLRGGWNERQFADESKDFDGRWAIPGWHRWSGRVPHFGEAKRGKTTGISSLLVAQACIDLPSAKAPTHWN